MPQKPFDDFEVGDKFVTYARTVTEADMVNFTCFAGLKLPVFIDEEFAREHTPFGGRIAPGLMTASLAAGMMEDILGPYTIAALELGDFSFQTPLRAGDTIHCEIEVLSVRNTSHPERGVLSNSTTVVNQKGETVVYFTGTFMMRRGRLVDGKFVVDGEG